MSSKFPNTIEFNILGVFLSTRAETENSGFFPEEEKSLGAITGVFGGGEEGNDPSGVVEDSITSGYSTGIVLATDPGNPPAVRVWTGKTVRFGSRPIQSPDPELLGRPNPYQYPSTRGFCQVWLDPSVPVSGSPFRVFLFMVAVKYVTVMCKILTLVHHSLYWFHWQC